MLQGTAAPIPTALHPPEIIPSPWVPAARSRQTSMSTHQRTGAYEKEKARVMIDYASFLFPWQQQLASFSLTESSLARGSCQSSHEGRATVVFADPFFLTQ